MSDLTPDETVVLSLPVADAVVGVGGVGGVGGDCAALGGRASLRVRLTYRQLEESLTLPLDQYGFQVGLQHVVSFRNVRRSTGRDGTMWLAQWNTMLRKTAASGALPAEGEAFIKDLLGYHERSAEKMGCGLASVKVGKNPEHPDTSCFVLVRTDESEADFSYLKCLDQIFPNPHPIFSAERS